MNRQDAYAIVSAVLEKYRALGFEDLRSRISSTVSEDILGPSGILYTVDVDIEWSDSQQRTLEIRARIDDQNSFRSAPLEERIRITNPTHAAPLPNA